MGHPQGGWRLGQHIAPPRFVAFVAITVAATLAAAFVFNQHAGRALMIGFDVGSALFLVSLYPLFDDEPHQMRAHVRDNDANRVGLLGLTGLVTLVILIAVGNELSGKPTSGAVALVIGTLTLAWLFSNMVYALHYAHLFYGDADRNERDDRGLTFPDCDEPDYSDFVYFAFTLGMTFQTSDVEITARKIRRVVTGHCLAAFVFNLGVLAFTINVLGGG